MGLIDPWGVRWSQLDSLRHPSEESSPLPENLISGHQPSPEDDQQPIERLEEQGHVTPPSGLP